MWLEAHDKMAGGARQNAPGHTAKRPEPHSLMSYVNAPNILTEVSFFISNSSLATLFTFN